MRQLRSASASWDYDAVKRTTACNSPGFLLTGSLPGKWNKYGIVKQIRIAGTRRVLVRLMPASHYVRKEAFMIHKEKKAYHVMLKDYPDVMDIDQMSELLGISTKTAYKLLKNGQIIALKVGRTYRIPKVHILKYLKMLAQNT